MIKYGLFWTSVIIVFMIALSLYAWITLPDSQQFPVHWSIDGQPNRYAGKAETLFAIPIISGFLGIVFAILPLIDPRRKNLEASRNLYLAAWVGGITLSGFVHISIVYSAITGSPPSVRIAFIATGLFLAVLGNFMAKSRSNWFAGLRTPWTLSSEHAWSVGNRLSGWGLFITGLLTVGAGFYLPPDWTLMIMMSGILASLVLGTAISYFAWRNDPDRNAAGDS